MKTISKILLILILLILGYSQIQAQNSYDSDIANQINKILKSQTGYDYTFSIRDFNEYSENPLKGDMQDPYGNLENTYLFAGAIKGGQDVDPHGLVGVFKNNEILWVSEPLNTFGSSLPGSVYKTQDFNDDGLVELFVSWTIPNNGRFDPKYGYVFSWDGTRGELITKMTNDSVSEIKTHASGKFNFVDVDGDNIIEIYTDRAVSQEEPVKYERIYYSWNGQSYGVWPDTPEPDEGTFYPRDLFDVTVQAIMAKEGNHLNYQYLLTNKAISQQGINKFYLMPRKDSTQRSTTRSGWKFSDRHRAGFFYWSDWGMESDVISPGERDSSFSYSTKALPFITRYYIQGANETPTDVSFEEIVEDIKTNSVSGYTLGPADPPDPFDASAFTDSLHSYTSQACELEWITNEGICYSLEKKLDNVKWQLDRGNTKSAGNNVQAFLKEVEAVRRNHLTSEGYGLLWLNGQYLLEKLNNDH